MKQLISLVVLLSSASLTGTVAHGHHAFAANYDPNLTGTIEGVVIEVFWANPHVRYFLEVVNENGETELWDVESSNIGMMTAEGWNRETIEVGDRIRVSGGLGRDGLRRLSLDLDSLEVLSER
ncbi:MAG: DUF6152 family protein [Gammaproteobacteria bacterium]|nr:DUF6152 family protein [Gammaproteobacteria bacterium]MDH3509161.1 DUF6152 family protein [Gammaproteobacteria bacterium]